MAIDLNKDKNELKYYYSENGATLGPFSLSQLLEKIEADTLVYREGIDWTNAKDVEELRKFFKAHEDVNNYQSSANQKKKGKNKNFVLVIALCFVFLLGVFSWIVFYSDKSSDLSHASGSVEVKVYANIKKRNKIVLGSLNQEVSSVLIDNCLTTVFGDRIIKHSLYSDRSEIINDFQSDKLDILLLKAKNLNDFEDILQVSDPIVLEGYPDDLYLAIPLNNESHLNSLFDCVSK